MDRRGFLKASSVLGVGSVIGASALLAACSEENKMVPLKQPGEFYVPELPDYLQNPGAGMMPPGLQGGGNEVPF